MDKHTPKLFRLWLATAAGLLVATAATASSSQAILAPPGLAADDRFGYSIAASGNLLVVGAPSLGFPPTSAGSAYVYQRNGSTWTLQARLTPNAGLPGDAFGTSVAIDGNTIVVGAPGDNTFGFVYIFVNTNGVWVQQPDVLRASDNFLFGNFGASVSISKDTIAVGAPFTKQGAVYIYVHSPTTGFWDPQGKRIAPSDSNGLSFGASVSLVGDAVVIGAPRTNGFSGAAYVFNRQNDIWSQSAVLAASLGLSNFGYSAALSANTIVVGAPDGNTGGSGSAFVYTLNNGVWTQQTNLQGNAGSRALLGWSVAINGNTLALGAPMDSNSSFMGSTYVYAGGGNSWQLLGQQTPNGGLSGQAFGYSVAVVDGNTTVEGSPLVGTPSSPRTGAVYVTQR